MQALAAAASHAAPRAAGPHYMWVLAAKNLVSDGSPPTGPQYDIYQESDSYTMDESPSAREYTAEEWDWDAPSNLNSPFSTCTAGNPTSSPL